MRMAWCLRAAGVRGVAQFAKPSFESLLRKGASVEEVAREFSPPLVFDASFASRGAQKARKSELEKLAAY
eukprot:scaffold10644_cov107-Isochrysis_galbana.AAC.7